MMKKITLISYFLMAMVSTSALAQINHDPTVEPLKESMAAYQPHDIYIHLNASFTLGKEKITVSNSAVLTLFPELKQLMIEGKIMSITQAYGVLAKQNEEIGRIYKLKLSETTNRDAIIREVNGLSYIHFAERIPVYSLFLTPNDSDYNDPNKRWHLDQIGADAAWDLTTGCANMTIAIVDDAVRTSHEDLSNKIYTNQNEIPANGIDDDNNGYIDDVNGFDVADNDPDADPPFSVTNSFFTHGTHVAGIAAGESDNGLGNAAIGFNTQIVPVKTKSDFNLSQGGLNNPMAGVEYAIALGVDVINMSWGSYAYSAADQMVFNMAFSNGIVCVGAAGNDGLSFLAYPAGYDHVISVGASGTTNDFAPFTNIASDLDVFAPGVDIWSCLAGGDSNYGYLSGTSMAAPIISGLAALMICDNGSAVGIENCIVNTVDIYTSVIAPGGHQVRIANAVQAIQCSPPVQSDCIPGACELIPNGDFETPSNSNIQSYTGWHALAYGHVCSWYAFHGTPDCFPLDLTADNYAHALYDFNGSNNYWEGISSDLLDLVPGQSYILEFDYAVSCATSQNPGLPLDSIVIGLKDNVNINEVQIGAVYSPPVDFTYGSFFDLHTGAVTPNPYYHHFTLTFVAPTMPTAHRLVFYPRMPSTARHEIELDNISLRPLLSVQATASSTNIIGGNCVNLNATGSGQDFVWEPANEFLNPVGAAQTVCPDSTTTYIVTVYDSTTNCSVSDSITVYVEGHLGIDNLKTATLDIYPNPMHTVLNVSISGLEAQKRVEIYNVSGQTVYVGLVQPNQALSIDLTALSAGLYYCKVDGFAVEKLIKH